MNIFEHLKPPFLSRGIGEIRDSSERILLDVYENTFTLKDGPFMGLMVKLADWTAEAMNEKWKRDNPSLRWRLETDGGKTECFLCPECEYVLAAYEKCAKEDHVIIPKATLSAILDALGPLLPKCGKCKHLYWDKSGSQCRKPDECDGGEKE